jgi:peptidoglycan/LPS O-acetylase OafA/YrhL
MGHCSTSGTGVFLTETLTKFNKAVATKLYAFVPFTKSGNSQGTFFNIQILRGIAACMVVTYHSTLTWCRLTSGSYSLAWFGGASGVDIFFVISGFVMAISAIGRGGGVIAALKFFKRRVIRVMPLYWLTTTLILTVNAVNILPLSSMWTQVSLKQKILSYLLIPYQPSASPLIQHAWTLSYEMFFYLCLAIVIVTKKNAAIVLTILLSALVILGFFRTIHWPMLTVLFSPWLLEFLAGLWLGVAAKKGWGLNAGISTALGAIGFLVLWCSPTPPTSAPQLVWGICAVCVVGAAAALEMRIGKLMPAWALLLGDASYSIYLLHPFLLRFLAMGLLKLHVISVGRLRFEDELVTTLFCLICTVAIGIAVHKFIEYPMNRILTGKGKPVQVEASAKA